MDRDLFSIEQTFPYLNLNVTPEVLKLAEVPDVLQSIPYQSKDLTTIEPSTNVNVISQTEVEELGVEKIQNSKMIVLTFANFLSQEFENLVLNLKGKNSNQVYSILDALNALCFEEKLLKDMDSLFEDVSIYLEGFRDYLQQVGREINQNSQTDWSGETEFFIEFLKKYLDHYDKLSSSQDSKELEREINKLIADEDLIDDVRLLSQNEIFSFYHKQEGEIILPLAVESGAPLFVTFSGHPGAFQKQFKFMVGFIYQQFLNYIQNFSSVDDEESLFIWERAFDVIPMPLALIGKQGELILHNPMFNDLEILPTECLDLKNNDKIERSGTLYNVVRRDIENQGELVHYFIFSNEMVFNSSENQPSPNMFEDLGIISSSIAHELNNPLGGILASLDYLELEDYWDEDSTTALKDIRDCAQRAKDLVEIFLGFSKAQNIQKKPGTLNTAFLKAMDLMRFRMIESDALFNFQTGQDECFDKEVNLSIVTIIFYLILSNVLTSYGHYRLVSEDENLGTIEGSYRETKNKITLVFNIKFDIEQTLSESKLLNYLVDMEGLILNVENNKVVLGEWTLT